MSDDQEVVWPMPDNHWGCFIGGLAFSGVFVLVGVAILYRGYIHPYFAIQASQSWVETPCVILNSRVDEGYSEHHRGVQSSYDYQLEIEYRYEFEGKEYVSHQYGVTNVADTKAGWRRKVVQSLPKGKETVCYVNPTQPSEAALSREFHASYRTIMIPIGFVAFGLIGVVCMLIASVPDKKDTEDTNEPAGE